MAVARNQIQELLTVLMDYLPQDQIRPFLRDLMDTEAYRRNGSFKETVDRLMAATS